MSHRIGETEVHAGVLHKLAELRVHQGYCPQRSCKAALSAQHAIGDSMRMRQCPKCLRVYLYDEAVGT